MSYILDALRKSDQQRRRGAAPTLLPAQPEPAAPKRQALFAYAALAVVLLGAGIGIGWLRPWQPGPAAPAPAMAAVNPSAPVAEPAPPPQPAIAPSAQPELPAQKSPAAPGLAASAAPAAAVAPAPAPAPQEQAEEVKRARRSIAPRPAAEARQSPSPAATTAAAGGAPAQGSPVVAMSDLPVAIQQELPPMSISVHAYSGIAAQRLVGINNRLLHEGDEVAPGLKLEQITPNGMILSYKGYSFRHGVH